MKLNKLFTIAFLGATTICTTSLTSCKQEEKIIMATEASFAPFESIDTNGDYVGIDVEIAKGFAESEGKKLEVSNIDFDAILPAIQSGKADFAAAGMTVTESRKQTVDFTDTYYSASQVVIVKKGSTYSSLTTVESIEAALNVSGIKIGCQSGTTGESYIKGSEEMGFTGLTNTTCQSYASPYLACQDLTNGKINAIIIDNEPAKLYLKQYSELEILPVTLTTEDYAMAVQKGNTELLTKLNAYIAKIKEDGTLKTIIDNNLGA